MTSKISKIKENSIIRDNEKRAQQFEEMLCILESLNFDELTGERYTVGFIVSMFMLYIQGVDINTIVEEVRHLERPDEHPSFTKKPTQYKLEPLKGLWHKHFFPNTLSSVATNIINGQKPGVLDKIVSKAFADKEVLDKECFDQLLFDVFEKPFDYRARSKEITGEWIIYHKHKKKNCYLLVVTHPIEGVEDDTDIASNILKFQVLNEFPQFKNELPIFTD